jgi:hypothetical protein
VSGSFLERPVSSQAHLSNVSSAWCEKRMYSATTEWYSASRRCTSSFSAQARGRGGRTEGLWVEGVQGWHSCTLML